MTNLVLAAADAAHRAEFERHSEVSKRYTAGEISDEEFLASLTKLDAALAAWERAWEEEREIAAPAARKKKAPVADDAQLALF